MFQHNWRMWFVCYSSTLVIRPLWHYIACSISSGHMHGTWQAMSSKMPMSSSLLRWMWCTATVKNPTLFQQQTHTIVIALSIRSSPAGYSLMLYAKLASMLDRHLIKVLLIGYQILFHKNCTSFVKNCGFSTDLWCGTSITWLIFHQHIFHVILTVHRR